MARYTRMDTFHYNLDLMRNKSLGAGIPLWTYIWLSSNGRGHGVGFYRWQLFISAGFVFCLLFPSSLALFCSPLFILTEFLPGVPLTILRAS